MTPSPSARGRFSGARDPYPLTMPTEVSRCSPIPETSRLWIPACAGMTASSIRHLILHTIPNEEPSYSLTIPG
jgi:hypothetical protein